MACEQYCLDSISCHFLQDVGYIKEIGAVKEPLQTNKDSGESMRIRVIAHLCTFHDIFKASGAVSDFCSGGL